MVERAEQVRQTGQRIVEAALALYFERWLDEITLEAVAARAGIAVRTLQRRYGTRDGLVAAVSEVLQERVAHQRFDVAPGDPGAAIANLVEHYEQVGALALRNAAQAERSELVGALVRYGQEEHSRWVDHAFGPFPPSSTDADLRAQLTAVTDVAVWDVLRNRLGRSRDDTGRAMEGIVRALLTAGSR